MNEQLKKWIEDYDAGNVVQSVLMGGLGEEYEAAIQDLAIETMRQLLPVPVPEEKYGEAARVAFFQAFDVAFEITKTRHRGGYTGAMVGAAQNLANVFWKQTPEKGIAMMQEEDPSRIMEIKKADTEQGRITKSRMGEETSS